MATLAITNTFSNGTTADASQVNTNFSDISTWLNNRYGGSDTWSFMKVSATDANPVDIVSSAGSTEVSINNTAIDGDPLLTFKLSGSQKYAIGVDDSDSDFLKFATTGITTNVAFQIPSGGKQMQHATSGGASAPAISAISDANTGFDPNGSGTFSFYSSGTIKLQFNSQGILAADGTVAAPGITNINSTSWGLTRDAANTMTLVSNGASAGFLSLRSNGDILTCQLAPLATNATGGFLFLPTVAGTPSGTPTSYTGQVAHLYDVNANKIWVYNGSWRSVALT